MSHTFFQSERQKLYFLITAFILLEGIFLNIIYWIQPSSEKNARFGGYSLERLLIGGFFGLFLLGLAWILVLFLRKPQILNHIHNMVAKKLSQLFFRRSIFILLGIVLSILLTYLFVNWLELDEVTFSFAIFQKILPFLIWAIVSGLEFAGFLAWLCFHSINVPATKKEMLKTLLVAVILGLLAWQWMTLFFHIRWPHLFSQSVWSPANTSFGPLHYAFLLGWGLVAIGILVWIKKVGFHRFAFILLLLWGYIGQLVIPIRNTQPMDDGLIRYQNSPISHVLYSVCFENPGYGHVLSQYDRYEGSDFWLGTKPPGYMLFYSALADTAKGLSGEECSKSLPFAIFLIFPFLAVLSFWPMMKLSQTLYKDNSGLANVLLLTVPTFIYFSLIADQAIYPLLFISTIWLTVETTQRLNFWMAALLGSLLYLEIFISFSLLPAAGFTAIWFLLTWLTGPRQNRVKLLKLALMVFLISSVIYGLVLILGGYNPWVRYQNAFAAHREIKNFNSQVGEFISTIFWNNFEFFFWIGISVGFLFLINLVDRVRQFVQHNYSLPVLFSVTCGIIFIILNFAGQTKGEVSRLWLFILPMVILLASETLQRLPDWVKYAYVLLQILTILFCSSSVS